MINQWCRRRYVDPNRLNFKVYQWSASNMQYKNWAYNVKHMLDQSGLGHMFVANSNDLSKRYTQDSVCSYLQGQFVNEWNRDIKRISARRGNGRNKLRTYRMFKETYGTEK